MGRTLFVVQNRLNKVAAIDLAADLLTGKVRTRSSNPGFGVPTTVTLTGNSLYLPNARFSTEPMPSTAYDVIRIDKP